MEFTTIGSQAHRTDVVCEIDWSTELKQSNIVVFGDTVVTGMPDDLAHRTAHAVWIAAFQVFKTQDNCQAAGVRAETIINKALLRSDLIP